MSVAEIPIEKLYVGKCNVRTDIGDLTELTASIKEKGVLQPILVRPVKERYEIVVGRRRFEAAKVAKLKTIPTIIREMNNGDAVAASLVENIQRGDLGLEERVDGYKKLMKLDSERFGSYRLLAQALGKTHTSVIQDIEAYNALQRLRPHGIEVVTRLPPTAEERMEARAIPERHATLLERAVSSVSLPQEEKEKKYVELAKAIAPLEREDVERILIEFKKYPELPTEKLKERALARVPIVAHVPATVARRLDEVIKEKKLRHEEVISRAIEEYVRPKELPEERPAKMVREIDTGETWICPECNRRFRLIHCEPKGHRLEEIS